MRSYEYWCDKHGKIEAFCREADRKEPKECPHCGQLASYSISTPNIKLEGVTGDFPTAYDKWTKAHTKGAKQQSHWLGE